jgi:hypothetical protein
MGQLLEDDLKEWRKWEDEVEAVENIAVPRCFRSSDDTPVAKICGRLPMLFLIHWKCTVFPCSCQIESRS